MSYLRTLHFKQYTVLNKYLLEKCLQQCLMYQARLCTAGSHNRNRSFTQGKSNSVRRKTLRTRILHDIKQTKVKIEGMMEKENIWTIPNLLCVGRIATSPYLSYLILSQDYQIALWLLAFVGLSDLADGWIARTWTSQASRLGSFLDPVADKLLIGTLFLSLTWMGLIPTPLTCLVIVRDVILISAASYIRYRSLTPPKTLAKYFNPTHTTVQLAPTFLSKVNTMVQLCLVAGTVAAPVFHFVDHPILQGLCYVTAVTTLAGGLSYLISKDTYKILNKATARKNSTSSEER